MPPLDFATAFYDAQSPTLLAAQPASIATPQAHGKDWDRIFTAREARLGSLRTWRYSWWQYWGSLAAAILPRRYRWIVTANTMDRGNPINGDIVDSTATLAMQICAAGMWTGLTSPNRPWFRLGVLWDWMDLDSASSLWLYEAERIIYAVLGGSNFYDIMAQAFQDVATFGTAPVILYEDSEDVIRCYLPCAGEYYLGVGSRLTVDTFYREYLMTVTAIVEMFGLKNCPQQVRTMWENGGAGLDTEFVIAHSIEPNTEIAGRGGSAPIRVVPGTFAWCEVYWLRGMKTEAELSRKGFNERPFFVARWSTVGNDPYGRSPGMDCLGDTKQLQQETRRKGEFIEKVVRPPMAANAEMKNEPSSILPGQITYTTTDNGKKGFWPVFEVNPAALAPMIVDITEVQKRIEKCFFVPVFMAITQMEGVQPRNELEISRRDLEALSALGPFVNLFTNEFASDAVLRVLAIVERRGLVKPRPPGLRGVPLKIDVRSMLKLAQEAAETASMERTFATAGTLSAAAKAAGVADPVRTVNLDWSLHEYASRIGFPAQGFYSPDQIAQHDAERAKMTQQQAAMQATQAGVDAAGTLSKVQVGGGQSAVQALLGGGVGG